MRVRRATWVGLLTALMTGVWLGALVAPCSAQSRPSVSPGGATDVSPRKQSAPSKDTRVAVSPFTAGLVADAPQSTEFAIAQDIATTLAAGQESGPHGEVALRVVPLVGNGGTRDIADVLTLAGADMAIAPVILANRLRDTGTFGDIGDRLVYITPLYVEEFHLLARPEIARLTDLAGKTVNLGEVGSAGAILGREILNRLDVNINEVNLGLDAALDGMRKGQISAALLVSGKPVDALARIAAADRLHFLSIPYSAGQQDFLPSTLSHEDYPNLIPSGQSIDTIGIKSALFAYNWPARNERFRLMETFVQTFFARFSEFLGDPHHPEWREVNLAEQLQGWQRFRPAEHWLRQASLRNAFGRFLDQKSISNPPDREQLFQQFLRWRERQGK